jgi:pimeloyl-ACP methyl ester carboxylesterase
VLTSCDAFENFFPPLFSYLKLVARTPGGWSFLRSSARLKAVRRGPIAFGRLMRQDPPKEVLDSWTEPLRDRGVRRDVSKVMRGVDKRHTVEAAERLGSFDKPVLLAWATDSRVFPLADAQKLAGIFPDARLRTIQDSYAFVPEDQPAELARLMVEFMRETQPASAPS